ncbi:MAG: AAA family ATPase [Acidobacteriota bacterium]
MSGNPYNWQSHNPSVQIPRQGVAKAAELMRSNGSAVVMGGRGMGKSVFLRQLAVELEQDEGTEVLLIEAPPADLTVEAGLGFLAEHLGVPTNPYSSRRLFDEYFAREGASERLVLLFDEFDRYAEKGDAVQPPGRGLFNDLEAARRSLPGLSILAAGSVGVFIVRDVLGSSFLARALYLPLTPFQRGEMDVLVRPFSDRGLPSEATLDALFLASGGIPALLTYGLQELWKLERDATPDDVTELYVAFEEQYREYLRDLLSALSDTRLSDAPRRIWERLQQMPGPIARAELESSLGPGAGALQLGLDDALYLLQVTGAISIEGSIQRADPIIARPIASLLNLSRDPRPAGDLTTQFLDDLTWLLARFQRSSLDFFRPSRGSGSDERRLVPESVFSAHLALGFELLGWRTEREAQRGAGRTDILLRRNGDVESFIVELKIWGRNDCRQAQHQVDGYWTEDVVAGAVVQLTAAEIADWPERYVEDCLGSPGLEVEARPIAAHSPVRARFHCRSQTVDGMFTSVEHFLLRLPRRA